MHEPPEDSPAEEDEPDAYRLAQATSGHSRIRGFLNRLRPRQSGTEVWYEGGGAGQPDETEFTDPTD